MVFILSPPPLLSRLITDIHGSPFTDIHHSPYTDHSVDVMQSHSHVIEDSPATGVVTGGQAGAGESTVLQLAGDVVPVRVQ